MFKFKIQSIITYAYDHGIKDYDTASIYGNSEQILGDLFDQLRIKNLVRIYTKIEPLDEETRSSPKASKKKLFIL